MNTNAKDLINQYLCDDISKLVVSYITPQYHLKRIIYADMDTHYIIIDGC